MIRVHSTVCYIIRRQQGWGHIYAQCNNNNLSYNGNCFLTFLRQYAVLVSVDMLRSAFGLTQPLEEQNCNWPQIATNVLFVYSLTCFSGYYTGSIYHDPGRPIRIDGRALAVKTHQPMFKWKLSNYDPG